MMLHIAFFSDFSLLRYSKLRLEKSRLQKENRKLLMELIDADITRRRLENDAGFIEYISRTRHLLCRPGETIYRLK